MTVFKDYSENGELLQTRDEPLSTENLQRYIKENGIEKAQGYLQALEDMANAMKQILYYGDETVQYPRTGSYISRESKKLLDSYISFLDFGNKHLKEVSAKLE